MLRYCVFISLASGLTLSSGCGALKMPAESRSLFAQQRNVDELLDRLTSARSIAEIDAILDEILADKNGQKIVERLLSGWGKNGSWYDLAVVEYLWKYWPSYYGKHGKIDSAPLMPLVMSRLNEQPDLLPQLFWFVQWKFDGLEFPLFCRPCESLICSRRIEGEEFPTILLFAGAIRERHLVDYKPPCSTRQAWERASLYFQALRPFLHYESDKVAYVVDYPAQHEGRYLKPDEQDATTPETPLPNWDSNQFPERPARK